MQIIIHTVIGISIVITIAYILMQIGRIVEHVFQIEDVAEMPWIWPTVFRIIGGVIFCLMVVGGITSTMLAYTLGLAVCAAFAG